MPYAPSSSPGPNAPPDCAPRSRTKSARAQEEVQKEAQLLQEVEEANLQGTFSERRFIRYLIGLVKRTVNQNSSSHKLW